MARLQRKKTLKAKKKKKQNGSKDVSIRASSNTIAKKTAFITSPARELKRKSSLSQKKALTKAKAEPGKLKSLIDKGMQFLREVKVELKKVTWPTRKQTIGSTAVVLVLVMLISLFLGVVDIGLSGIIRLVFK